MAATHSPPGGHPNAQSKVSDLSLGKTKLLLYPEGVLFFFACHLILFIYFIDLISIPRTGSGWVTQQGPQQ